MSVYERYWVFNGFAVEAPISVVQKMATRDDVAYIIEDRSFTAPIDMVSQEAPDNATANWNIYQVSAPADLGAGLRRHGPHAGEPGLPAWTARTRRWPPDGAASSPGHSPADSWFDPFGISPELPHGHRPARHAYDGHDSGLLGRSSPARTRSGRPRARPGSPAASMTTPAKGRSAICTPASSS